MGRLGVDVVLVYPGYTVVESLVRPGKYHVEEGGWYAEGLAALAARLKEAGHRPCLLHLTRPSEEEGFVSAMRGRRGRCRKAVVLGALAVLGLLVALALSRFLAPALPYPICAVIAEHPGYPQYRISGLDEAEIVFEWLDRSGASQFLAVFTRQPRSTVGPISPLSVGGLDLARTYGRVICSSLRPDAVEFLNSYRLPGPMVYRPADKYVTLGEVLSQMKRERWQVSPVEGWRLYRRDSSSSVPAAPYGGRGSPAPKVVARKLDGTVVFSWRWNGRYYQRRIHGETVRVQAVAVLFADEESGPFDSGSRDCPAWRITRVWELGNGRWLLEEKEAPDNAVYWLWDSAAPVLEVIVGGDDNARLRRVEDGQLVFFARGGGESGALEFPYEIIYDLETGKRHKRSLYLPVYQEVVFGSKHAWPQVLTRAAFDDDGVSFEFQPKPGTVLAGFHWLPDTSSTYDHDRKELVLTFRDVAPGQGVKLEFPLRPAGGSLLEHVVLRPTGDDLEARIRVKQEVIWNAEIQLLDGNGYDSTVRCRLSFWPPR